MLWVKSLHLFGVFGWMAGLFYLPRIFVHFVEGRAAGEDVRRLLIMARRLHGFMSLLAIVALGAGLWLWLGYGDTGRWLMVKLIFVVLLILYQGLLSVLLGRMRREEPLPSGFALRLLNEGVLLIFVPILILAVVKPF
jgi:protoporphyrinogen IX oxidase